MFDRTRIAVALTLVFAAGFATAAPPKVVTAPNSDPKCFEPWAGTTKLFQYPAKKGPYRIALANGYIFAHRVDPDGSDGRPMRRSPSVPEVKEFRRLFRRGRRRADADQQLHRPGYDAIVVNA
jgi:hypothetical protein